MDTETKALWSTTRQAMGKTWTVELWADDAGLTKGGSDLGHQRNFQQYIRVNAKASLDTREETVLHELIHTVASELNLTIDEDTVARLSIGLFAFLRGFGLWREFPWPDREPPPGITGARRLFVETHPNLTTKPESPNIILPGMPPLPTLEEQAAQGVLDALAKLPEEQRKSYLAYALKAAREIHPNLNTKENEWQPSSP